MQAIVLIGMQASGKSSFCMERVYNSLVRIHLDMFRTRYREKLLIFACHDAKQPDVVDNTNPMLDARVVYIQVAKSNGFRVVGYYFASKVEDVKLKMIVSPLATYIAAWQ